MSYVLLFIVGFVSWFVGTVTAGGAGLIFLVVASFIIPLPSIPIIIGFTGTIAGFYRAIIYRHDVDWPILYWLLPGTIIGSLLGAGLFASIVTEDATHILKFILAFILILSGFVGAFKKEISNFKAYKWFFFPFGLGTSILSGLIGASSPMVNILFQKFPLSPNQIVGTKAINIFVLQITKSLVYSIFILFGMTSDMLPGTQGIEDYLAMGVITANGASIGVYGGRKLLSRINEKHFNTIMNLMLVIFGLKFLLDFVGLM